MKYQQLYINWQLYIIIRMPLSIKNQVVERLARQIAQETGESLTEAIQKSLEQRLGRLKSQSQNPVLKAKLLEILNRVDALPTIDHRSADEILGYDENGIPR
jgi:antitoxin VapB